MTPRVLPDDASGPTVRDTPQAVALPEAAERRAVEAFETQRVKGFRWVLKVGGAIAAATAAMDLFAWSRGGPQYHVLFAGLALLVLIGVLTARVLVAHGRMDLAVPIPLVLVLLVTPVGPMFTASRAVVSLPLSFLVMMIVINFAPRRHLVGYGLGAFAAAATTLGFMQADLWRLGLVSATASLTNFIIALLMSGFIFFVMGYYSERLQSGFDQVIRSNRDLVAVHRDLRHAEASKIRFMNSAAHELNTPLTPIRLRLALLARCLPQDDERAQHAVAGLDRSFVRLSRLIGDILDGTRMNADRLVIRSVPVDLSALVEEAADDYGPAAEEGGLRFGHHVAQGVMVEGDPLRLRQVIDNLLSNAMKFTQRGGTVDLSLGVTDTEAAVTVWDTGIGISREGIDQVFEAFSQVHDSTRAGSGLGLYIAKGIVQRHGGRIWVKSPGKGNGTTFGFHVPLLEATTRNDETTAREDKATAAADRPPDHGTMIGDAKPSDAPAWQR